MNRLTKAFTAWWHRNVCAPDPYPNSLSKLDRLDGLIND